MSANGAGRTTVHGYELYDVPPFRVVEQLVEETVYEVDMDPTASHPNDESHVMLFLSPALVPGENVVSSEAVRSARPWVLMKFVVIDVVSLV